MSVKNIDIKDLTSEELDTLMKEIEERKKELQEENKKRLREMVEAEAKKMGISPEEFFGELRSTGSTKTTKEYKYQDDKGNKWTGGRGRVPDWVQEYLKSQGVDKFDRSNPEHIVLLDKFLIDKS